MKSCVSTIRTIASERSLFFWLWLFIVWTIPWLTFADTTELILDGQPDEPITGGTNRYFTSTDGTFSGTILSDGAVGVAFHDAHNSCGAVFRPPAREVPAVGTYDDAANHKDPFDWGAGTTQSVSH
jgi:hypothetical protein